MGAETVHVFENLSFQLRALLFWQVLAPVRGLEVEVVEEEEKHREEKMDEADRGGGGQGVGGAAVWTARLWWWNWVRR